MSGLDELLANIDPSRTLDPTAARADQALNAFPIPSGLIADWEDFKVFMSRLLCHIENGVLRLRPPRQVHPQLDWGRCARILVREFGGHGEKAAFEMARTGNEGGFYAVIRAVAKHMAEEYAFNEIHARINGYWKGLSADAKIAAVREYVAKFGHLLPSELTEGTPGRIMVNFLKVLEEHPRLVQRMRRIGRGVF